jgi:cysteine synthase A
MKITNSITDLTGRTPMVGQQQLTEGLDGEIIVKSESRNPGGSAKNRLGHALIVTIICGSGVRYLSTPLFGFA